MLARKDITYLMTLRKTKSKKFRTQAEARKWALAEKKKHRAAESIKWETNRLDAAGSSALKWEAVIYRDVK